MWLYNVIKVLVRVVLMPFIPIFREGRENIPREGRAILVSNHISDLDPIVLVSMTRRHMRFMAKVELFSAFFLGWAARTIGAFPINRGTADLSGLRTALDILQKDGLLALFPEGTRNRARDGSLLPLNDGVAFLALKSGAPIIPVYIAGRYGLFTGLRVKVGRPVDLSDVGKRPDRQTMDEVMGRVKRAILAVGGVTEK